MAKWEIYLQIESYLHFLDMRLRSHSYSFQSYITSPRNTKLEKKIYTLEFVFNSKKFTTCSTKVNQLLMIMLRRYNKTFFYNLLDHRDKTKSIGGIFTRSSPACQIRDIHFFFLG